MLSQAFCPPHWMKRLTCLLAAVGLLLGTGQAAYAAPAAGDTGAQTLLVQFAPEVSDAARDAQIAQLGAELVAWMPQIRVAELRLPVQDEGMAVAAAALTTDGPITFAESDMVVGAAYTPTDPDWVDATMRYGQEQIAAPAAWDIVTGAPEVVIAVVDSGVNPDHPELAGRLTPGYDFVNRDDRPDDDTGHGTHVAGIIAAAMDNGMGLAGICPHCRVMPVKVLNASNLGSWSALAQGILYAADHGARVINLSVGATVYSETLAEAVRYAVAKDVLVVAAAGNYGNNTPFYPAALDDVVAVSATTAAGVRWDRSNYGSYVDLAAPGDLIFSTFYDLENIFGGYTYMSGTSMASPFVAGVAGLLLSVEPNLSAAEVTQALTLGADDLGQTGWDAEYGFGRVNAYGALMAPLADLVQAVGEIRTPNPTPGQSGGHKIFLPAITAD